MPDTSRPEAEATPKPVTAGEPARVGSKEAIDEWLDRSGKVLDEMTIAAGRAIANMPSNSNAFAGTVEHFAPDRANNTPHYDIGDLDG